MLVVDDEPDVLDTIVEVLEHAGHQVQAVGNVTEALDMLEARQFDAVLSDMRMPGMDGAAFYEALVTRQPHMRDRFACITGDLQLPQTSRFVQRYAIPVLEKPFMPGDVLALLERLR